MQVIRNHVAEVEREKSRWHFRKMVAGKKGKVSKHHKKVRQEVWYAVSFFLFCCFLNMHLCTGAKTAAPNSGGTANLGMFLCYYVHVLFHVN